MHCSRALLVLAAALAPLGAAQIIIGEESCLTSYGPLSVRHVPTYTTRQTVSLTLVTTKTKTPVATVTPTSTLTATSVEIDTTTLPQQTDTVTDTALTTTTNTEVVDITITNTDDVTITITQPPTVTVSTASNFTPFASEAAVIAAGGGSENPPSKKRHEAPRFPRRGLGNLAPRGQSAAKKGLTQARYPQSVQCIVWVEDITSRTRTITATTTRTHTAPAVISTSTVTDTITSTAVPGDASTTVTTTSTVTSLTVSVNIDVTTTTVTTSTTSFSGPTVTYYPQCQPDNLIAYVGGQQLFSLTATNPTFASTPDAVTCCQMCANTAGCSGFSGPQSGFTDCYLFNDGGTCDASQSDWTVFLADGQTSDFDVVGNGNCGQGTFGGQE